MELAEETIGVPCFMKLSDTFSGNVNCKKMPGKVKIMYLNLCELTLSQLFFIVF